MFAEVLPFNKDEYIARQARLGRSTPARPTVKLLSIAPEVTEKPIEPVDESKGYVPLNMLAPPSWKFLLAYVSLRHNVSIKAVTGNRRSVHILNARYAAIGLIHTHQKRSTPEIGKIMNRDHSSICHVLQRLGINKTYPSRTEVTVLPERTYSPKPKGLTALQQAIKRGYKSGTSAIDIAEAYGCSPKSIHVIAHRLGLKHPGYRRATTEVNE